MTASCPVVYGRALLSAPSARVSSSLPRMPQTNKSRNVPASDSSGASAEDTGPVAQVEIRDAGGAAGGGGEDNVGDSEIIKSPSDPKEYR